MSNAIIAPKHSHETFEVQIKGIIPKTRKKSDYAVRQERFTPSQSPCFLNIEGKSYVVSNYSSTGIAINTPLGFAPDHKDISANFFFEGSFVQTLKLNHVRTATLDEFNVTQGFAISEHYLELPKIEGIKKATSVVESHLAENSQLSQIPRDFRLLVLEVFDRISAFKTQVNQLEDSVTLDSKSERDIFTNAATEKFACFLNEEFERSYNSFHIIIEQMDKQTQQLSFNYFRTKLRNLLYETPFGARCLEKPLGYAGDHEMMSYLYRNESIGKNLFAKALHRFYMNHPNGRAVRNRGVYLKQQLESLILSKKSIKSLSVACGPAYELRNLISGNVPIEKCEFHLLDQDLSALQMAQKEINLLNTQLNRRAKVTYLHKAIRNILASKLTDKYDIIYSAGLFDYFSDPVAIAAAKALYKQLLPGGKLVIGNFTTTNDRKLFMELSLDWHLIYRNEKELKSLYRSIGPLRIESEPEGVNLFVVLEK